MSKNFVEAKVLKSKFFRILIKTGQEGETFDESDESITTSQKNATFGILLQNRFPNDDFRGTFYSKINWAKLYCCCGNVRH